MNANTPVPVVTFELTFHLSGLKVDDFQQRIFSKTFKMSLKDFQCHVRKRNGYYSNRKKVNFQPSEGPLVILILLSLSLNSFLKM